MGLNIIGISALYHDSACCLLQDGFLVSAAQEERFTRKKNDSSIPCNAFNYCLKSANLSIADIDYVAYYEEPVKKLARQLWSGFDIEKKDLFYRMDPKRPEREISELLGYNGQVKKVEHHLSHAASSYLYSGFDEAAILTNDGVGEWDTTTYGYGKGNDINIFDRVCFPDSIGLFYSSITSYLGFKVNSGEYKVMGLAPYGKPVYAEEIYKLIKLKDKGQYVLDMKYFDFINGNCMYSEKLCDLLGQPPRIPESEILQFHKDVARSLQYVLEDVLLQKVNYLYEITQSGNLCMAGGVALNCVANGRILRESKIKRLFVQPAAGDAGASLGAAAIVYSMISGKRIAARELEHVYLGPEYSYDEIKRILNASSIKYINYSGKNDKLIKDTADLLANGNVIGWFQGRMEFGPRALGNRSILADPRDREMRDRINAMVKKREGFRPFAPAILEEKMKEHFNMDVPSPFMLNTCKVKSPLDLPAITHVDNSARVQTVNYKTNPLFAELLKEFDKITGCPILLNTSFNVRSEPIVMSPYDALICFVKTDIDSLVLGDFIIKRNENSLDVLEMIITKLGTIKSNNSENLYTFI